MTLLELNASKAWNIVRGKSENKLRDAIAAFAICLVLSFVFFMASVLLLPFAFVAPFLVMLNLARIS